MEPEGRSAAGPQEQMEPGYLKPAFTVSHLCSFLSISLLRGLSCGSQAFSVTQPTSQ